MKRPNRTRRAFTVIELLVVIGIIMILAAIVLVFAVPARQRAYAANCANQMRQIGMALGSRAERGIPSDWARALEKYNSNPGLLLCPQGPQDGRTNYGVNEALVGRPTYVGDSGETVLLYESERAGDSLVGDERDVDLRHMGAANFVYVDGHVARQTQVPAFGP